MIKKLRKFSNMKILCITNSPQLQIDMNDKFKDCQEIICIDTDSCDNLDEQNFDILLVDCDNNSNSKTLNIMNKLRISKPLLPKIVISENPEDKKIVQFLNAGAYSILSHPLNFEDLKFSIIMALNQSKRVDKVLLNNGIYYDSYRERFYNQTDAIAFTKFEFQVLKLLLDNHDKIIGYEEIKNKIWKDKKMSIFTMRNVINKIRNKTYYGIIVNNSSAGYRIDNLK